MTDRQPSTRFLVACIGLMIAGTIDVPGLLAFLCGLPFGIAVAEELLAQFERVSRRLSGWFKRRAHLREIRRQWEAWEGADCDAALADANAFFEDLLREDLKR